MAAPASGAPPVVSAELEPAPVVQQTVDSPIGYPRIARDGAGTVMAWVEYHGGARIYIGHVGPGPAPGLPWRAQAVALSATLTDFAVGRTSLGYTVPVVTNAKLQIVQMTASGALSSNPSLERVPPDLGDGNPVYINSAGVAPDGDAAWVTWYARSYPNSSYQETGGVRARVTATRVLADGTAPAEVTVAGPTGATPVDSAGFSAPNGELSSAVASNQLLVAWTERFRTAPCPPKLNPFGGIIGYDCSWRTEVRVARFGADGAVLTSAQAVGPAALESANQSVVSPLVVADGTRWWVFWTLDTWDQNYQHTPTLQYRRVGADGAFIDAAPVTVGSRWYTGAGLSDGGPMLSGYGVLNVGGVATPVLSLLRLDTNGQALGAGEVDVAIAYAVSADTMACSGPRCLAIGLRSFTGSIRTDLVGVEIDATSTSPVTTLRVGQTSVAANQRASAMAAAGGSALVVWGDERSDAPGLYGALVDGAGTSTSLGILSTGSPTYYDITDYDVGAGADGYLVGWSAGTTTQVRRIGTDGALLDAQAIVLAPTLSNQQVDRVRVAGGDGFWFLAARQKYHYCSSYSWGLCDTYTTDYRLWTRRLSGAGVWVDAAPADTGLVWSALFDIQVSPGGSPWALTVTGHWPTHGGRHIGVQSVLSNGALSPFTIELPADAPALMARRAPLRLGFGPVGTSPSTSQMAAWTVGAAGQLSAPTVISDAASRPTDLAAVASSGTGAISVWTAESAAGVRAIWGARVDAAAKPVDTPPFTVGVVDGLELHDKLAAAALPNGKLLVGYVRRDPADPYGGNKRVRLRTVDFVGAAGDGCLADDQCASGFCVDGVCCDTACGGGAVGDCAVCSVTAGGAVDGTCGLPAAGPCLLALQTVRPAVSEPGARRELTLEGAGFTPATQVAVAGATVHSVVWVSTTRLRVDATVSALVGTWDITVSTTEVPGGLSDTLLGGLTTSLAACADLACAATCVTDADCLDGDPCTGDWCEAGACRHALDTPGCCAPAATGACGACVLGGDLDGDGVVTGADRDCAIEVSLWLMAAKPGAAPLCAKRPLQSADLDCDGRVTVVDVQILSLAALGVPPGTAVDADGDGCVDTCSADTDGDGSADHVDCAPLDSAVFPGATEVCNGLDDDCDGVTDPTSATVTASCDDGDPCTADACVAGVCTHTATPGAACTSIDTCVHTAACQSPQAGAALACLPVSLMPCCQWAVDPVTGAQLTTAVPRPTGSGCDDGVACTGAGTCLGTVCQLGTWTSCTNPATCGAGVCDPGSGQCLTDPTTWVGLVPAPPTGGTAAVRYCQQPSAPQPAQGGFAPYDWTAADCGGALPASGSIGVLSRAALCGADTDWSVWSPPPWDAVARMYPYVASPCAAGDYAAAYLSPADGVGHDLVVCEKRCAAHAAVDGSQSEPFTAAECGGVMPPAGAVGVLAQATHCGGDRDFEVLDPAAGQGAGVAYTVTPICNGIGVRVVYIDLNHAAWSDAVVCTYEAAAEALSAGAQSHVWSAAECGGSLPGPGYVGLLAATRSCAAAEDWRADNPAAAPAMTWWQSVACTGPVRWRVVYVRRTTP